MKARLKSLWAITLVATICLAQNHLRIPHTVPHPANDHICWGYAMARAGSSVCDPMTFMPNTNEISSTYFNQYAWSERDNSGHRLASGDVISWSSHAAYVRTAPREDGGNGAVIVDSIHVAHTAAGVSTEWSDDNLPTARGRLGGDLGYPSYFWKKKQVSWTVENDFYSGNVKIDGASHPSGADTSDWWRSLPLEAINQDYANIYRVWHDWEGNYQNPYNVLAGSGDLHHANFAKWCDMTFNNSLPGVSGGTISVWDTVRNAQVTVRIPYGNTFHAIAIDQDISSISYIFSQWADGSSIPRDRSITPSQHGTYTAQFTTKPFAPDTLRQIAAIGQNVHLTWGDNPNSRVTKYHIYRAAPSIPEQKHLVDSVSSGVQSWYDNDVIVKGPRDGPEYVYYVCGIDNQTSSEGYEATTNQFGQPVGARVGAQLALEDGVGVPTQFSVGNYPNPFNPSTTIAYSLMTNSAVKLDIFDVMGRKVRSLVDGNKSAGYYSVVWNGRDESGKQVASGMYLYRFTASPVTGEKSFTQSGKLILTK